MAKYDKTILVGTPGAIEEAAKLRKLGGSPKQDRGLENVSCINIYVRRKSDEVLK